MFLPPRCPNSSCPNHLQPSPGFFLRRGYFLTKCRPHPVPRFRCRFCRRGFSRQTFRADYRDHRPDLNARLFRYLASGLGLRQSARLIGLSRHCTELKFRKLAAHLRLLNLNLRRPLSSPARFQLDELETYEGKRNTRPLSVPVLIEHESRFVVWALAAPIRPRGKMTPSRRRAIARDEARFGPRRDRSRAALRRVLVRGRSLVAPGTFVVLRTDEKVVYPELARRAFEGRVLVHERTNSRLPRTKWNPLFPINHTEAMARDLCGRLRRESWLVSKLRRCLDLGLHVFAAYRNYVRRRFNRDPKSPAQVLGIVDRRMTPQEVLSWRQDWGARSIHPLAGGEESVAEWRPAVA